MAKLKSGMAAGCPDRQSGNSGAPTDGDPRTRQRFGIEVQGDESGAGSLTDRKCLNSRYSKRYGRRPLALELNESSWMVEVLIGRYTLTVYHLGCLAIPSRLFRAAGCDQAQRSTARVLCLNPFPYNPSLHDSGRNLRWASVVEQNPSL